MKRSTGKRAYDMAKRDAKARQTRQRIIDAVGRVLVRGIAALTMPAVAKKAGVSVPTVYRHFADKQALIDAAAEQVRARAGVTLFAAGSLAELIAVTRKAWVSVPERSAGARVLAACRETSPLDDDAIAWREAFISRALEDDLEGVHGKDRTYFLDVAQVLCGSAAAAAFERLRFDRNQAGERVGWLLETLLLGVRARLEAGDTNGDEP